MSPIRGWDALALAGMFTLLGAGCGDTDSGGGGDAGGAATSAMNFCDRMDECDELEGQTSGECAADIELCLDERTATELADWEAELEDCLALETCDEVIDCYWEVPYC